MVAKKMILPPGTWRWLWSSRRKKQIRRWIGFMTVLFLVTLEMTTRLRRYQSSEPSNQYYLKPDSREERASTIAALFTNSNTSSAVKTIGTAAITTINDNKNNTSTETIVWCILDPQNTIKFRHFAHAAQSLLPCWSVFEQKRRELNNNDDAAAAPVSSDTGAVDDNDDAIQPPAAGCGVYLLDLEVENSEDSWTRQLIQAMGCELVIHNSTNDSEQEPSTIHLHAGTNNLVVRPDVNPRKYQWFTKAKDAASLRRQIWLSLDLMPDRDASVDDVVSGSTKHHSTTGSNANTNHNTTLVSTPPLRIGFIDRKKTRKIIHLDVIQEQIHAKLSTEQPNNATIIDDDVVYMEDLSFAEQVAWWSSHDIVVLAHGAGCINLMFLPVKEKPQQHHQNTVGLVELYPQNYYPFFFYESLIEQVEGVQHYPWYNQTAYDDLIPLEYKERKVARSRAIDAPVDEIVRLIHRAVRELMPSTRPMTTTITQETTPST